MNLISQHFYRRTLLWRFPSIKSYILLELGCNETNAEIPRITVQHSMSSLAWAVIFLHLGMLFSENDASIFYVSCVQETRVHHFARSCVPACVSVFPHLSENSSMNDDIHECYVFVNVNEYERIWTLPSPTYVWIRVRWHTHTNLLSNAKQVPEHAHGTHSAKIVNEMYS